MKYLKQIGITRRIDELGRIVIPMEIRRNLGIRDGENLEISVTDDTIFLKKHFQIHKEEDIANKICDIVSSVTNSSVIITDREKIIATDKDNIVLKNVKIDTKLLSLIDNRKHYQSENKELKELDNIKLNGYFIISPIISSIDSLGLVILFNKDIKCDINITKIIARILAEKIDIC